VDLEGERVTAAPLDDLPFASRGDLGLDRRKVTQCALSRICGVCGQSLARPVAFLGSTLEADRNEFHFPPSHVGCAETALSVWAGSRSAALGHLSPPEGWALVTTSGFEYIRPSGESDDRRSVFSPNSVISTRVLGG
jgi:hypothetical protein